MEELVYVEGLGEGNTNCNAEKVNPKKAKKRSEKQKERVRQYKKKMRKIKQQREQERLLNEMTMYVYQVPDKCISKSEVTPVIPQVWSSARLPSPALGILSPKTYVSLRGVRNIFETALAMQYIERVSTLRATADVFEPAFRMLPSEKMARVVHKAAPTGVFLSQSTGFPKQAVQVSTLNASAKPFVPAAFRRAEQVPEAQSVPSFSVDSTILDGNQKQETVSTSKSSAEPATPEAVSISSTFRSTFIPSGEKSSHVPATKDEVCGSTRFDAKHPNTTQNYIIDKDDMFGILDVYAESCLLSDITVTSSNKTEGDCGYVYFSLSNLLK